MDSSDTFLTFLQKLRKAHEGNKLRLEKSYPPITLSELIEISDKIQRTKTCIVLVKRICELEQEALPA
jgi:hypothetical protein